MGLSRTHAAAKDPQEGDTLIFTQPPLSTLGWEPWIVTLEPDSGGVRLKVNTYGCSKRLAWGSKGKVTGSLPAS